MAHIYTALCMRQQSCEAYIPILLLLQMRNLQHREGKWLGQNHVPSKWHSQDSRQSASILTLLITAWYHFVFGLCMIAGQLLAKHATRRRYSVNIYVDLGSKLNFISWINPCHFILQSSTLSPVWLTGQKAYKWWRQVRKSDLLHSDPWLPLLLRTEGQQKTVLNERGKLFWSLACGGF